MEEQPNSFTEVVNIFIFLLAMYEGFRFPTFFPTLAISFMITAILVDVKLYPL